MRLAQCFPMCVAVLLSACSPSESNVAIGNRTGVLHYGIGSEVQALDPHVLSDTGAWEISSALFEGLVRLNPETLEPEPGVAKSWELSDDGLTLIFKLNREAKWSNGDPVTAEDFVWSWQRSLLGCRQCGFERHCVSPHRQCDG